MAGFPDPSRKGTRVTSSANRRVAGYPVTGLPFDRRLPVIQTDPLPDLQVVQSLDPGLDRKAIEAVSKWRFQSSVRDGNPVAVVATFEVNFKLR